MDILNNKQKTIIIVIVIFMLLFIGYYIINKTNNSDYINLETEENEILEDNYSNEEKEIESEEKEKIIVHVTGAVNDEGIVKVESGSRISDIIEEAGGITEEADLSKINLAYEVKDGQKINVPNINDEKNAKNIIEDAGENVIDDNNERSAGNLVNINTATQTELETLNGIGPSTALKIINYRKQNGDFEKIEDLKNVPGIGDSKFENIKEDICIK